MAKIIRPEMVRQYAALAIDKFETALEMKGDDAEVWYNYGKIINPMQYSILFYSILFYPLLS